jgi:glycosyltransferase involved in cell wall biosynthesis
MRVLLVSNYRNDESESMQRFASMMRDGLTQAGHEVRVMRPPIIAGRIKRSTQGIGKWLGYFDKFVLFPAQLRAAARWADVVHICDHSNAIYTRYLASVPHVVTCHDLLAVRSALGEIPQHQTGWTGRQFQRMILNGLRRAKHIACVSQTTKDDVLRLADVEGGLVSVIYNGLNYPYSPMPLAEASDRVRKLAVPAKQRFLFHVGGNGWYKNRPGVLQIFSELLRLNPKLDLALVMAGKPWTDAMMNLARELGLEERIIRLPAVSNEDLRALYTTATALLFPSIYEGFGWPILEAQACGCMVFTTNRAPMNEVGGDAAIYIDPEDTVEAARIIARYIESKPDDLRGLGIDNAARFSNQKMLAQYLNIYASQLP